MIKKFDGKILLDIGSGATPQKGFKGMDIQEYNNPDVVTHNWDNFPWPFKDESVLTAIGSHVAEHVNPVNGHFIDWMNEIWRIMQYDGQVVLIMPYAGTHGYYQDPTHCNPCNEDTWNYFDPMNPSKYYNFYEPAPWAVERCEYHHAGNMEVILRKRRDDVSFHKDGKLHFGRDTK